jgi:hypothetical protein
MRISLLLLAGTVAASHMKRSTQDAITIFKEIRMVNTALEKLDRSIQAIDAANIKTQFEDTLAKAAIVKQTATEAASKIQSSPPLVGMYDTLALVSGAILFINDLNSTMAHLLEKRKLVLDASLDTKMLQVLQSLKPTLVDLVRAPLDSIPRNFLPDGAVFPDGTRLPDVWVLNMSLDVLFNVAISAFKAENTMTSMGLGWMIPNSDLVASWASSFAGWQEPTAKPNMYSWNPVMTKPTVTAVWNDGTTTNSGMTTIIQGPSPTVKGGH